MQNASADLVLTALGIATVDTVDDFRGDGFSATPSSTQLNSNTYRATGFTDGDGIFGGTLDSGDFARGTTVGDVALIHRRNRQCR